MCSRQLVNENFTSCPKRFSNNTRQLRLLRPDCDPFVPDHKLVLGFGLRGSMNPEDYRFAMGILFEGLAQIFKTCYWGSADRFQDVVCLQVATQCAAPFDFHDEQAA